MTLLDPPSAQAPTPEQLADLAGAASSGDMSALAALYDHYSGPVWLHVHRRTRGDRSLTDEITSATWEKVVEKVATYDATRAGFARWVYVIADSVAVSYLRRVGMRPVKELAAHMIAHGTSEAAAEAGPDELAERADEAERMTDLVAALPQRQREAILLTVFEGLSITDAAQVLGVTSGAVKEARLRGFEKLRAKLGQPRRARSAPSNVYVVNAPARARDLAKEV